MQYSQSTATFRRLLLSRFRPGWGPSLAVLVLLPLLLGLGGWQLQRAEGKRQLLAQMEQQRNAVPATLDELLAQAARHFPEAPVEAQKGWSEMIHRYFAGSLALSILALAVQALRRRREAGRPLGLPLTLLALVIGQALFGMWTVTLRLWPQVVTGHLLGGMATLALLFLLALRLSRGVPAAPAALPGLRLLAAFALALTLGQIALGGWVSSNYAALACPDLPTCHGQWWPEDADFANAFHLTQAIGPDYLGGQLDGAARTAIHLSHRLGALAVALTLALLAWRLARAGLGRLAGLLLAALALQLGLGLGNVLLHLPLAVAVAHNGGAALLLLSLVLVNYRLRPAYAALRQRDRAGASRYSLPEAGR